MQGNRHTKAPPQVHSRTDRRETTLIQAVNFLTDHRCYLPGLWIAGAVRVRQILHFCCLNQLHLHGPAHTGKAVQHYDFHSES